MPAHDIPHALFESDGPARHAVIEDGARFGPRHRAGAITQTHGGIADHVVLIWRDMFADLPDRRAHATVRLDGVPRPVAAGIVEEEAARKRHSDGLVAEFPRVGFGHRLHGLEVSGTAVQEEDADLFTVCAARDLTRV